jgi:hypothetical protein
VVGAGSVELPVLVMRTRGRVRERTWELALSVGEVWGARAEQQTRKEELWRRACARARRGRKKRKGDDDVCARQRKLNPKFKLLMFPLCRVSCLVRVGSEHAPIILSTGDMEKVQEAHFHFEK